jgi:hypothetical protein
MPKQKATKKQEGLLDKIPVLKAAAGGLISQSDAEDKCLLISTIAAVTFFLITILTLVR